MRKLGTCTLLTGNAAFSAAPVALEVVKRGHAETEPSRTP